MKSQKNYYPLGLAVFGVALVAGLGFMIKIAVQNPVEMDNSHMMPYGEFDKNYDKIVEMEKRFDEKFTLAAIKPEMVKGSPVTLELNVSDKEGKETNAKIVALITRPDTSKHDIKIEAFDKHKTSYVSKPFKVALEGRWKIIYKIQIDETQKFVELESFATKAK